MPNYVRNLVKMEGITDLPLFLEVDGKKRFDFNKLIHMPEELNVEDGSMTDMCIVYFLTERCSIPIYQLGKKETELVNALVSNMFSSDWPAEVFRRMSEQMRDASEEKKEAAYEGGRRYVSNYEKYGCTTWYGWCNRNWGTKWNACDTEILDKDTIMFDTAWSNPEPVMEKLGEMYPNIKIEHWWADEDVGHNTGHRVMLNGGSDVRCYDGDGDAYSIYTKLWGESDCVYLDENGVMQHRDCENCNGCD